MAFEFVYSSMSAAKRGAVRAKLSNPVFTKLDGGKIQLSEHEIVKLVSKRRSKVSNVESPVAVFRELFKINFGKMTRGELIKLAIEKGIAKNTAATHYQWLTKSSK